MSGEMPRFVWVDGALAAGRRAADHRVRPRVPAGRRDLRDAPRARRPAHGGRGARRPAAALRGRASTSTSRTTSTRGSPTGSPTLLAAEGLDGPDADASIRITVTRGAWASRGLLPPRGERLTATIAIQAWPVVPPPAAHLERRPPPRRVGGPPRPRQPDRDPQDDEPGGLRVRAARGAPGGRRRRPVPDA